MLNLGMASKVLYSITLLNRIDMVQMLFSLFGKVMSGKTENIIIVISSRLQIHENH